MSSHQTLSMCLSEAMYGRELTPEPENDTRPNEYPVPPPLKEVRKQCWTEEVKEMLWEATQNKYVLNGFSLAQHQDDVDNSKPAIGGPVRRSGGTIRVKPNQPAIVCDEAGIVGLIVLPNFVRGATLGNISYFAVKYGKHELRNTKLPNPPAPNNSSGPNNVPATESKSPPNQPYSKKRQTPKATPAKKKRGQTTTRTAAQLPAALLAGGNTSSPSERGRRTAVPTLPTFAPRVELSKLNGPLTRSKTADARAASVAQPTSIATLDGSTTRVQTTSPPAQRDRHTPTTSALSAPLVPSNDKSVCHQNDFLNIWTGVCGIIHLALAWHALGQQKRLTMTCSRQLLHNQSNEDIGRRNQFLFNLEGLDFKINVFADIFHPTLMYLASSGLPLLAQRSTIKGAMSLWHSNFYGRAILMNVQSGEHLDCKGVRRGFDAIVAAGEFKGGDFRLHDIDVDIPFPPGTLIAFDGTAHRHSVKEFTGPQRISLVSFFHRSVFDELELNCTLPNIHVKDIEKLVRPKEKVPEKVGGKRRRSGGGGRYHKKAKLRYKNA
ncbi:2OG-Fe(II) oxygenase family protein [Ceratobasidium sp. AG-Ba]|nr:2OG-Fe(II) oxygenase family protein [Ceratobasidium sp. AG-Ba]